MRPSGALVLDLPAVAGIAAASVFACYETAAESLTANLSAFARPGSPCALRDEFTDGIALLLRDDCWMGVRHDNPLGDMSRRILCPDTPCCWLQLPLQRLDIRSISHKNARKKLLAVSHAGADPRNRDVFPRWIDRHTSRQHASDIVTCAVINCES